MRVVTFGEVMLRISPENPGDRLAGTRHFRIEPAGSEANVAVALSNLGVEAAFVSRLPVGLHADLVIRHLRQHNVKLDYLCFGDGRLGTFYAEIGVAQRSPNVIYDREDSSFSRMRYSDVAWDELVDRIDWFHTSGITPAVSKTVSDCLLQALPGIASKCPVSVDLNYRSKLWKWVQAADTTVRDVMSKVCGYARVICANESDFYDIFGYESSLGLPALVPKVFQRFPKLEYVAVSQRSSLSASHNRWAGELYVRTNSSVVRHVSPTYDIDFVVDRVGGGDSFSAGILFGLMTNRDEPQKVANFSAALSALKHSVRGDFCQFTRDEVLHMMATTGSGRIVR